MIHRRVQRCIDDFNCCSSFGTQNKLFPETYLSVKKNILYVQNTDIYTKTRHQYMLSDDSTKEITQMALPPILKDTLKLPVVGSPLFIISNPDLVIAQCKAGDRWLIPIT